MKKLFVIVVLIVFVWHHAFSLDLNITLRSAGDLINQVDLSRLDEVESLTIAGDLNGTDILVIRKMVNLQTLDMADSYIVNGGDSYYNSYTTSKNQVGAYFFKDKHRLRNVILPNSVTSIGSSAFEGCTDLTLVTIGKSVTSIGSDAFLGCSSLTSVTIPNSVTSVGSYTFSGCSSLTSVTIPNSVISIGRYAFSGCSSLTSITIGKSVTSIDSDAFKGCSSLTSVTILCSNVDSWFKNMTSIKEVVCGDGVTSIGSSAFSGCSSLTSVTIGNSVTSVGGYAFRGCSSLTSVTIGKSVTSIGSDAFSGCSSLTSVTIPNSVTSIGGGAFYKCSSLTSVNIQDIAAWCKITFSSNPFFYAHHLYLNGVEVKNLIIPNSVTSIGEYVFYGCSSLTSVTIPNSVTSIGDYAFIGCTDLTSVTIGKSVTSIGSSAFSGCSSLTSVTIPNSVTSIGDGVGGGVFEGCTDLTSVTIGKSVTYISSSAFKGCSSLTSVTILCPNVGSSWFKNMTSIKEVMCGDGVTSIGSSAFSGCTGLTSVAIPNSVTSIGGCAFYGCSSLTSVTIPNSVTSIGDYAFYNCSNLTSVTSLNTTPPQIYSSTFSNDTYKSATLNVPVGCKNIYWLHPYWENFTKIEEIDGNEDISEKKALALKSYQDAMSVYGNYIYYYKGDAQKFYQTTIDKQSDNQKVSSDIMYDIEKLEKQISESSMSDDEKASYNKALDEIDNAVYVLKKENESGYYINFNYRVEKNNSPFSDYYSRLEQYKERIDAATTNDELDAIIAEIDAYAAGMKDYYLNPIIDDYNEMVRISQRFTEIGDELKSLNARLNELTTEIETAIAAELLAQKKEEALAVYNVGLKLCGSFSDVEYNGRKANEAIQEQHEYYNVKYYSDIRWQISELRKMVEESEIETEKKNYFLNVLDSVEHAADVYIKCSTSAAYGYNFIVEYLDYAKDEFTKYSKRLEGYKNSIESATSIADVEAVVDLMNSDKSNMESMLNQLREDYNNMLPNMEDCKRYGAELLKLLQRLKDLKLEFDNLTSGIEQVLMSDDDEIVVNLRGERMKMKSNQINTLPKGIYIVNGRKYIVK